MRRIFKVVVLITLIAALVAWVKLARVPVAAHEVRASALVAEVKGTGTLEARVKTTVSTRIQEHLDEVLVDQGDAVKEGQLLARLNDSDIRAQIEVATAALAAAQAGVERVKSDEARALAVEQNARLNHQRVSELLAKRMASQESMDNAVEQLHVAEAESPVVTVRKCSAPACAARSARCKRRSRTASRASAVPRISSTPTANVFRSASRPPC